MGSSEQLPVPSADWRTQIPPDARQRIVNNITNVLWRSIPVVAPEGGMLEIKNIAMRFEDKVFSTAVNQSDYLRKISLKLLSSEAKTQLNALMNSLHGVVQNSTITVEGSDDSGDTLNSNAPTDKQSPSQPKGKGKRKLEFVGSSSNIKNKQNHGNSVQASLDKLYDMVKSVHNKLDHEVEKAIEVLQSLDLSKEEPRFFYLCLRLLTEKKDAGRVLLCLNDPEMQVKYLKTMIYDKD